MGTLTLEPGARHELKIFSLLGAVFAAVYFFPSASRASMVPSTLDPDEDLVDEEGVAVAAVPATQSMRVMGSELVAPEADRLVGGEDAAPGQQVLDVPVA